MVVDGVVDHARRDQRRDDECGDADAELIVLEMMLDIAVGHGVTGRHGSGRGHVVVETPVLVEDDQQQAVFPVRRVADGLVHGLDELFAAGYVIERVHGIAAGEVTGPGDVESVRAVFWLDEDELGAEAGFA